MENGIDLFGIIPEYIYRKACDYSGVLILLECSLDKYEMNPDYEYYFTPPTITYANGTFYGIITIYKRPKKQN